jgi:hypothetical protein
LEQHSPPIGAEASVELLEALAAQHAQELDALRSVSSVSVCQSSGIHQLAPEAELEHELSVPPPSSFAAFRAHIGAGEAPARPSQLSLLPQRFLRQYAQAVLGARVMHTMHVQGRSSSPPSHRPWAHLFFLAGGAVLEMGVADDGPWTQPPFRCAVLVLGVRVACSLHSNKDCVTHARAPTLG